jgi:hypothetical protein
MHAMICMSRRLRTQCHMRFNHPKSTPREQKNHIQAPRSGNNIVVDVQGTCNLSVLKEIRSTPESSIKKNKSRNQNSRETIWKYKSLHWPIISVFGAVGPAQTKIQSQASRQISIYPLQCHASSYFSDIFIYLPYTWREAIQHVLDNAQYCEVALFPLEIDDGWQATTYWAPTDYARYHYITL